MLRQLRCSFPRTYEKEVLPRGFKHLRPLTLTRVGRVRVASLICSSTQDKVPIHEEGSICQHVDKPPLL